MTCLLILLKNQLKQISLTNLNLGETMAGVIKKNTMNCLLVLSLILFCVSFVACNSGGGGNDIPEPTPTGGVDGNAVDALVINGTITIFEWASGAKGARLAQTTTDENGYYSVAVQAESQPVLIQLEGGYYIEESSGTKVDLKDGQQLFCVTSFAMGSELSVMVTPWTTVAYGLTQYYISDGENVENAITLGNAAISTLVDVLITKVCPQNITEDIVSDILSDELQYGFFCAAISEWTKNISIENGHDGTKLHSYWNSIYMSQLMYRDIAIDGQLNGRGWSVDKSTVVELSMGSVLLDAQVYRKYIGLGMINAANSTYNHTGLTVDDILGSALQFANRVNDIFEHSEPLPIDNTPPTITRTDAVGTVYSGLIDYQFTVKDHCGVAFVSSAIGDAEPVTIVPDSTTVTFPIDTNAYDEGENELVITAEDALGNSVTTSHTLTFNNVGVSINITSASMTNREEYRIEGTYTEVNTKLSEINLSSGGNDYSASLNSADGTWTATLTLSNGSNSVDIEVVDNVGNVNITEFAVDLDQQNPFLTNGMHSNATYQTETGLKAKQIKDNYTAEPVFINIYNSSLNGCPVAADNLIAEAEIPYFNFMVEDLPDNGVSTAPADLSVTFDFFTGGNQLVFGNVLTPAPGTDNEYLIPLCTEYFTDAWAQQTDTEIVNLIKVSVEDQAGNQTQKDYEFTVYFNAPVVLINSFTENCTVVIRSFIAGTPGAIIATGTTDIDGRCGLNVATESQPIYICLSEGRYFEQSSGNYVDMESGQEITAVYNFNQADCSITVSPLTHLAAVLAEHSYSAGKVDYSNEAVDSANATISQIYGIDVVNTEPLRITSFISGSTGYTKGNAYCFILAGMSQMCCDVSEANTTSGNMSYYNSVLLTQSMGTDIAADGKLDGKTGSDLIYFGDPIDPYFYRNTLADAILEAVNSTQNQTGFEAIDVLDSMTGIAECGNDVYGYLHPVQMFDTQGPEVVATNFIPGENVFGDTATLEFAATDKIAIDNVVFKIDGIDGEVLGTIATNFDAIAITIDTTEYINGEHTITAIGTDVGLGNESSTDFIILIDNAPPVVTITSNTLTNLITYTIEGTATDEGAGVATFSLGLTATSLKPVAINVLGEFAQEITLIAGVNIIYYEIIDNKGKPFTGTTTIDCDTQPPYMTTGNLHSRNPRFISDRGNVYTPERLNDTNEDDPLYIHYTMVSLGDTEMEVSALNDAGYTYFRMQIYDWPSGDGDNIVKSAPTDLRFQMRYKQGPSVILDWHDITADLCTAGLSGVFVLVPLCDEALGETWSTNESSIHQIEIMATDLAGNSWTDELTFKLKIEQTGITTDSTLLDNIKTIAYSDFIEVQGGTSPYTWSLQSGTLPCDLSLNSSTGEITGNGAETWCGVGVYPVIVRVTDANGKYDEKGFTIQLVECVTIPTEASYTVTNNNAVAFNINATGGHDEFNFKVESGAFPGGMTFEHINDGSGNHGRIYCDLYGVIDQPDPGTFTVTITATDTTDDRNKTSKTFFFKVEEDIRYGRTKGKESYVCDLEVKSGEEPYVSGMMFDGIQVSPEPWVNIVGPITKTIDSVKWKFSRYPQDQGSWPAGYKKKEATLLPYNITMRYYFFQIKRERCPGGVCP